MRRFRPAGKPLAADEQHDLRPVEEFSDKDIHLLGWWPLERSHFGEKRTLDLNYLVVLDGNASLRRARRPRSLDVPTRS
jgi:hypothetical protein